MMETTSSSWRKRNGTPAGKRGGGLDSFLEGMSRSELIGLVRGMAERHPPVRAELADRKSLSQGVRPALVRNVRRKIREAASEPGWRDRWSRYGDIPDYSGVRSGLEALLAAGYADEVLDVAEELLEAGTRHVEESDDEGRRRRSSAVAWTRSRKPSRTRNAPRRANSVWAIEAMLSDEYDLYGPLESYLERPHEKKEWSAVADHFLKRLGAFVPPPRQSEWSRSYERDHIADRVILALFRSGATRRSSRFARRRRRRQEATSASSCGSWRQAASRRPKSGSLPD